ncbi:hypothetical protein [Thalassotalea fusca]
MLRTLIVVFSVLLLTSINNCLAEQNTIAAGVFLGVIEKDGSGAYQRILQEAANRANIKYTEHVYPLKRAVEMFKNQKTLAIYGMTHAIIEDMGGSNIITSYPLGAYKAFVFTPKTHPKISSYSQLAHLKIGAINGYQPYFKSLTNKNITIDYFTHEDKQLERLRAGRIDAIIGFLPDWLPYLSILNYDPNFPIHIGYDYMTVWNTQAGQNLSNLSRLL